MNEKAVLVISDTHCGSVYGLLPPDFVTSDDRKVNLNAGQAYLWKCWLDLCERVKPFPVVAVVLNGDLIDGQQPKSRGSELCLPLLVDQGVAATQCLQALKAALPAAVWYAIKGTAYHDSDAGREAEAVAERIGATPYNGMGQGRFSRETLDLEIDGVILNFQHGTSVAGGLYRATPPDREAVWSALAGKEGKAPKADAVVRAHGHFFVHVEHPSKHAVIGPCWQLQTTFMRRTSAYRMLPDVGAILLWVDGEAKKRREDGVRVTKILYDLPPVKTVKL